VWDSLGFAGSGMYMGWLGQKAIKTAARAGESRSVATWEDKVLGSNSRAGNPGIHGRASSRKQQEAAGSSRKQQHVQVALGLISSTSY
jgi:hypothetical protein